jgi:polyisoprenoid-binding protein YceI
MRNRVPIAMFVAALTLVGSSRAPAADTYAVDGVHSSVSFRIQHLGISEVHGRFNDFSGSFTIDKDDPAKSTFTLTIQVESIDTNQKQRDEALRGPQFFDVKQYPSMKFKSTAVKAVGDGYQVTGDLTMHGVTKSITFTLHGGKTAEFPKGVHRIGFTTDLVLKRSEFGMNNALGPIGDDVHIAIGLQGMRR